MTRTVLHGSSRSKASLLDLSHFTLADRDISSYRTTYFLFFEGSTTTFRYFMLVVLPLEFRRYTVS